MATTETGSGHLTPDQRGAHQFLADLRTRIATQPLPYQYGIEARAMESLWELFALARAAIKDNPGCERFAQIVTNVLNVQIRPITSKWHKPFVEGRLNSHDGADAFRSDLRVLQETLRKCADMLHRMAYAESAKDELTPSVGLSLDQEFKQLPFGIPNNAEVHSTQLVCGEFLIVPNLLYKEQSCEQDLSWYGFGHGGIILTDRSPPEDAVHAS